MAKRTVQYGEYWHECARCGWDFPEHKIQKNNRGQWICYRCWDENENREEEEDNE